MARIRVIPRAVERRRKLTLSLKEALVEGIDRYAEYLGGDTDRVYVIEQVLEQFLAGDSEFQRWLNGRSSESPVAVHRRRRRVSSSSSVGAPGEEADQPPGRMSGMVSG